MSDFCPVKMVDGRCKDLDSTSYSYKLQDGRFALDAVIPADLDIDEARMSVWVPFADGKRRDGVGDLLEVGGIVCERHRTNPISLFDHGKEVTLPIGLCEDPETKAYTVQIDPVEQVARANVFFYQDGHKDRDHGLFCDQLYDLLVKRYVRAGSIGYQVIDAVEIPPDYTKGIPQGMHLKKVLMLEASVVVLPANADTTRKALSLSRVAGKPMSPVLYKSLSSHIGEVKAQVTSGYEQKSCSGDDDLCETIRQILDSLSEEEESGIDVWVNKDTPHIVIIDVMDWGDPKVGEKIGNAAKKIVGDEHIIFHNEGAKPQGSSWERIRGTKTLEDMSRRQTIPDNTLWTKRIKIM